MTQRQCCVCVSILLDGECGLEAGISSAVIAGQKALAKAPWAREHVHE